jgi:IS30 family transposase
MRKDCVEYVARCLPCQNPKHGFHPVSNIIAQLPMDHISIDLKEFVLSQRNNKYMLVAVDICTKFVFLRALPNKTMEVIAQALFEIFGLIGFAKVVQSDNGKEFVNQVLSAMFKIARIDHRLITAYHARANGT